MAFLSAERSVLAHYLPELATHLRDHSLAELETPGRPSAALGVYKSTGAGNLLISKAYGGLGATAEEALRVQCALGARAPSLAVASAMHLFSVATLTEIHRRQGGSEGLLIEAIARGNLLLASGFAEGVSGQGILAPSVSVEPAQGGIKLSGRKAPCSLTWSMDLLSVSAAIESTEDALPQVVVALIPANSAGLTRERFWNNQTLIAAESDAVLLDGVFVPDRLLLPAGTREDMDPVQRHGFLWFTLLIGGAYLGMAQGAVERVLAKNDASESEKASLYCDTEALSAAMESLVPFVTASTPTAEDLTRALCIRYHLEEVITKVAAAASRLMGGISYIQSNDLAYLLSAVRCLAFHPPTFGKNTKSLISFAAGIPHAFE